MGKRRTCQEVIIWPRKQKQLPIHQGCEKQKLKKMVHAQVNYQQSGLEYVGGEKFWSNLWFQDIGCKWCQICNLLLRWQRCLKGAEKMLEKYVDRID